MPRERGRIALTLILFAILFAAECVYSYRLKSATWDEPIHVADGYFSLFRNDYRFDPEHPPLVRILAALPLIGLPIAADDQVLDATFPDTWATATVYQDAHRFLYEQNDADRLLYRSRFVIVLLGVLLGVVVFLWTYEWLGFAPAVAALAMVAFEPNVVAHFSLVTTDAALAGFSFAASYGLWRTVRRPTPLNIAVLCLFCALAAITKFTAVLLFPAVFAVLAIAVFPLRRLEARAATRIGGLVVLTTWIAIWAVYGFRYAPGPNPEWVYHFHDNPYVAERVPAITKLVAFIDENHLLPNVFSQGFLIGQAKAQVRAAFLVGAISDSGFWSFFPIAIAIKTPLAFLLLAAGGIVLLVRSRTERTAMAPFLVIPLAAFLLPTMASRINIGLRHVLVIYPFFAVAAGLLVKELLARRDRLGVAALAILAAAWLGEYGRAYPNTLTFFNTLVGGPARGGEYLVDSNLDWGQDLKPLKAWMDAHDVREINLAYFGLAEPRYYGIRARYLNGTSAVIAGSAVGAPRLPGYVAVSKTIMTGMDFDAAHRDYYKPLKALKPVTTIGGSIDVYYVEKPW